MISIILSISIIWTVFHDISVTSLCGLLVCGFFISPFYNFLKSLKTSRHSSRIALEGDDIEIQNKGKEKIQKKMNERIYQKTSREKDSLLPKEDDTTEVVI